MYFTVFGKENCPYCVRAKELLQSKLAEVSYFDVMQDSEAFGRMNSVVQKATGSPAKTVPQIFVDDRYIGGYTELVAHFESEREVVNSGDFNNFEL